MVISKQRFEETKSVLGGIAYPANRYGRVLYQAPTRFTPDLEENATKLRGMLESRYEDLKSDRLDPIDGEEAFARFREKREGRRTRDDA